MSAPACWCGNRALSAFGPDYLRCEDCQTLLCARMPGEEIGRVAADERGFYGRDYWFAHQEQTLGLTNIRVRARRDLPERCLYWLRTALRYRLPPARVLEVGCGHGGFVALMRLAGFEATGLELSPWIVRFARETFDVPMLQGPVESQALEPGSLDMVVLMDVMEHLRDPLTAVARCLALLKPDGIVLIQTPCYPAGTDYETLSARRDRFLECLQPGEHLHLFSRESFRQLFRRLGAGEVAFEPAFFAAYDMFAVVARQPILTHEPADVERALAATAGGRIAQAIADLGGMLDAAEVRVADAERDRAARLDVIEVQSARLGEVEGARNRLEATVEALGRQFATAEEDRAARLRIIEEQRRRFEAAVATAEEDRAARLRIIEEQGRRLGEIEGERNRLDLEAQQLRERLRMVEAEVAALSTMHDEEVRALMGQLRPLQEMLQAILATRAYRLLRRLGYWEFVKDLLARPLPEHRE